MLSDCLLIIVIALFTALLGEGLTWVLVYRSEEYKRSFIPYDLPVVHNTAIISVQAEVDDGAENQEA